MFNRLEFEVLRAYAQEDGATPDSIARSFASSKESVDKASEYLFFGGSALFWRMSVRKRTRET